MAQTFAITVHAGAWTHLSPEVAAMVAPPVSVTAAPVEREVGSQRRAQLARSHGNMPVGRHHRPAR